MSEPYYIVYSEESDRIHWFVRKEKADLANLLAIKRYVENYKEPLLAQEILLSSKDEAFVKSVFVKDNSAALALIRAKNPIEVPISYPNNFSFGPQKEVT